MIKFSLAKKLHAPGGIIILNVSCQVEKGQFISLYGASGAGKTSILRMLGGFMQPDKGEIICNGEVWYNSSKKINVPPQKRKIGFVFQDYALFPNMNVRENLLFALDKDASINIVDELLATIGLADLQNKSIHTLSGGQKQRIALARALVRRPSLLLLDEPLSAVDNEMRERLQDTLLQVHRLYNLTTILVSHDLPEIGKLSDKTIWLENGVVKDYRTPAEMFFTNTCEGVNLVGIVLASQPGISCFTSTILIGGQIIKIETTQQLPKGEKVNVKAGDVKVSINV